MLRTTWHMRLLQIVFCLLPLLLPLPHLGAGELPLPEKYQASELMNAAVQVIQQYVSPRYNRLAIMDLSRSIAMQRQHRVVITYLLHQFGDRLSVQLLMDTPIEEPKDHILFLIDSSHAFRSLRFHFAKSLFDKEFYFWILFPWQAKQRKDKLIALREIFETCRNFQVLNAFVLLEEPDGVVLLYGFRLFSPDCQSVLTPELLDRFENGKFQLNHKLFPRLMGTFYGCPLNVSWYPQPPFVIFNGDYMDPEQRSQTYRLTGIDGELLKKLADIFDFRINLLPPCRNKGVKSQRNYSSLGYLYSSDDCFEQLRNLNSSVAIGLSASLQHRNQYSGTYAYHQSALVFVVRVEPRMGTVYQLIQPFCGTVWFFLALSCLLALLLQWAWHGRQTRFDATSRALFVHTTLLGNPLEAPALPLVGVVRGYLGFWLLLALVLRGAYQGKLYDVFRLPNYPPVPESIADLLSEDYVFLATDYTDYFPRNRTVLLPLSDGERFDHLEAARPGAKLATNSLLDNLVHYNQINWRTSRLTPVKEHIFLYQLIMYLRRHSIIKFGFDRKLKQLQSAGIVGYVSRHFEKYLFRAPYTKHSREVLPLRLELLCGLLFVCELMISFAFLVFVLELLSLRFSWLRRYFV